MRTEARPLTDAGLLILRVSVGLIFLTHGWPKLMNGASETAEFFGQLGIPAPGVSAWFITLLEFAGGLALVLGAFVSILSVLFILHMTAGIFLVHLANGWYVIGPGQGGSEFNVLLIASLLLFILAGSGRPAVDDVISARRAGAGAPSAGTETGSGGV
ncbi:MAG: DoxX family protein [Gemmatimonadota bacterium]